MAITSKTRKELWAKSGNRCAICKKELVNQISEDDGSFIIGDECHIISSSAEGPRYKPGIEDYDSYDNLLLLCKNHHREIDENCTSYTEELLHYIKTSHENWVKETLDNSVSGKVSVRKPRFIKRIVSGKELLNIFPIEEKLKTIKGKLEDSAKCVFPMTSWNHLVLTEDALVQQFSRQSINTQSAYSIAGINMSIIGYLTTQRNNILDIIDGILEYKDYLSGEQLLTIEKIKDGEYFSMLKVFSMPIMDNPATREKLAKALFCEIETSKKLLDSF